MLIPLGKCRRITRYILRIVPIGEFPLKPKRSSIMHQVDDRIDLQLFDHVRNDLVGPAPIELALFRLELVPGSAPTHRLKAKLAPQSDVFAPMLVMPEQLELIERTTTVPRLRDKGVFYTGRPNKILGLAVPGRDLISQL